MSVLPPIVLASSSKYRRALLDRLGVPYVADAADIDERRLEGEEPAALVLRLAEEKARAVASRHPGALIIGSDQVASLDGEPLGKPGGRDQAIRQLESLCARSVCFLTGLCLFNSQTGQAQCACESYWVEFRKLSRAQITAYVDRDRPFDCAGGFKSEGLGIALFTELRGEDPNALIGLPLIRLTQMLEREGVDLLTQPGTA